MEYLLGIDPSIKKAGYVILEMNNPLDVVIEKGLLRTSDADGILIQRLLKQQGQVRDKIDQYQIKMVGMEAPYFGGNESEHLFALNQFLHALFLEKEMLVVAFPPSMLKKLTRPEMPASQIEKGHMIDAAKTLLGLHGKRLSNDVADGFWAGHFGRRFYQFFVSKTLKEKDLVGHEPEAFCGKHEFTRGMKKGLVDYYGIIYRENELFFDFASIKRRLEKVS